MNAKVTMKAIETRIRALIALVRRRNSLILAGVNVRILAAKESNNLRKVSTIYPLFGG